MQSAVGRPRMRLVKPSKTAFMTRKLCCVANGVANLIRKRKQVKQKTCLTCDNSMVAGTGFEPVTLCL